MDLCRDLDLRVDHLPIGGADDVIDVAHAGDLTSPRKLVVTSGLHGIEGYCGSAAQIAFLRARAWSLETVHVLVVHVINPAGMKARRRVNGANVDLNRNVLDHSAVDRTVDARAAAIDDWVNSVGKFRALGAFWMPVFFLRLMGLGGISALKEALAGGQFVNPDGLFYGGDAVQPEIRALADYLSGMLGEGALDKAIFVDLHSGIGSYGQCQLLATAADVAGAEAIFRTPITMSHAGDDALYSVRGDLLTGLMRGISCRDLCGVTFECGTGPALRTFLALRLDTIAHRHFAHDPALLARARARMTRAFCPDDPRWRQAYVAGAARCLDDAVRHLSGEA
ncbi:M14 family metallopeptidase [Breoghania sp. L-A4]|uniref:M14 family metallopeptidase n=1 Tax=Breoghania sp. L-A4 TaxID=2304600 RepID=UPI0020C06CDD|nr:M14 family metallopeptidase [Breoghania sp. L-A4]